MTNGTRSGRAAYRRVEEGVCEVDCLHPGVVAAARASLPPADALAAAADAFKALAHPGRLRILRALDGRELCVCDIAHMLGASMSGTSQQLRELRRLGAIQYRVSGKLVFYTLCDASWLAVADSVLARFGGHVRGPRARRRKVSA
jgi:ArsR family transcriptional regulator, lead/cadmium/zinc/bismuth-responsive transcriptional repressor